MVAAVFRVKDEADVIASTVGRMLEQVDHVIVEDNGSTDGTLDILRTLPVELLHDSTVGYYQSQAMTRLAGYAAAVGADWVIPADADEVWLPRTGDRIADVLESLDAAVLVCEAPLFDHVATGEDPDDPDAIRRLGWRRPEQAPLRKVAVRPSPGLKIHQGNHSASFNGPHGVLYPPAVTNALEVRHFPYRSPEQMIRKARNGAAAYAATDLPEEVGAHWRGYGRLTDDQIREVFGKFFWREKPGEPLLVEGERQPPLVYDPA